MSRAHRLASIAILSAALPLAACSKDHKDTQTAATADKGGNQPEPASVDKSKCEPNGKKVVELDINGDKKLDIVCIGASTGNLKWYENLGR